MRLDRSIKRGRPQRVARRPLSSLIFLGGALCATGAGAGSFQVQVVSSSRGEPVADAAVCLGTPANPDQFGAFLSSADGTVAFAGVPRSSLLLIVSKRGYRGEERQFEPARADRSVIVSLTAGGLGPECRAVTAYQSGPSPLRIRDFRLNGGAATTSDRRVTLGFSVSGEPTHYRASETQDLSKAKWKPLTQTTDFMLSAPAGSKTVYLQVRRFSKIGDSSLEQVSAVASDDITFVTP